MGSSDEVSRRVRQGYRVITYPMFVGKKRKEYMKTRSRGRAISGEIPLSTVNARKYVDVDGHTIYISTAKFFIRKGR